MLMRRLPPVVRAESDWHCAADVVVVCRRVSAIVIQEVRAVIGSSTSRQYYGRLRIDGIIERGVAMNDLASVFTRSDWGEWYTD